MKRSRIRICHIVNRITGRADGIFKHLVAQFELINGNSFEHILICPYSQELEKELINRKIEFFFVPELDSNNYLKVILKVFGILKKIEFDIICCHLLKPMVLGGYYNLFNRRPIIFFSHGIFLNNDYNTTIEKFFYKILFKILFKIKKVQILSPSDWNRNKLLQELGKEIKIQFYYDGEAVVQSGDTEHFQYESFKKTLNKDHFKIIFVGRLAREKDPLLAIKIFESLNRNDVDIHFFGEGELENLLKDYVANKQLTNVYFHGLIKDVAKYFNLFDVLLLTSKREGMPIVIWESMYHSLPFVAKNVGGIQEILQFGESGFVFDTIDQAVEKLNFLIQFPVLRKKMGNTAREVMQKHFSKDRFINFFIKFYNDVC